MPEHYQTLTRTYRPRTFDDIVSQDHVSDTLKNAIKQNRLAHAYMFCGPRGVGKTTMARVLARKVNEIGDEVSGESLNQTLNIIEIDAASNRKVHDIERLRETVRVPPQNRRYKIYIIDEVHMLSKTAFNALLKTLEEPPDHIIFIFATTEPHKVLPTILSRVQRFDFRRINISEIVARLQNIAKKEGINIDDESLHVIAKKADGALRDALGLLDQAIAFCGSDIQHEELLHALNVVSADRMFQFMDAVKHQDPANGLQLIDALMQEGYDIQEFLVGLTEHLRNLYVSRQTESMHLIESSEAMKKRYLKASEAFSEDDLMRMLYIVSEAQFKIKEAQQPKIQFEITLLKLIHMGRSKKLNTLIGDLKQLKKNGLPEKQLNKSISTQEKTASTEQNQGQKKTQKQNSTKELEPSQPLAHSTDEIESPVELVEAESSEPSTPAVTLSNHIFEKPSLENRTTQLAETVVNVPEEPDNGEEGKPEADKAHQEITLPLIKEKWESYIVSLKKQVPQMIYFQMQRVEPIQLENRDLLLRCNDHFAQKMVAEHKRQLATQLKKVVGGFLKLQCVVKKNEESNEPSMSPYERFKKLQEQDPKIKMLVELFAAELDYNLNR